MYEYAPLPEDELVNPLGQGVGGWFNRIGRMFTRSWRSLAAIFAVTQLAPTAALTLVGAAYGVASRNLVRFDLSDGDTRFALAAVSPGIVGLYVGLVLLSIVASLVSWGAATYAVTREAAGLRVGLGEALTYGLRRSLGLFGWLALTALICIGGLLACVLPVFYTIAATALVGPIFMYERGSAVSRSFSMFHRFLGPVLGRLALILVITLGADCVVSSMQSIFSPAHVILPVASGLSPGQVFGALIGALLSLPVTMFQFAGVLLTYTEHRGQETPTSTESLVNDLQTAAG